MEKPVGQVGPKPFLEEALMERSFGLLIEPPNPKHWKTEKLYGSITDSRPLGVDLSVEVDLRPFSPKRHDQGRIGSCVANAVCKAIEIKTLKDKGSFVNLSRMAVYYLARELMVPTRVLEDSGTYVASAFDAVRRFGTPAETDWDYDVSKVYTSPSFGVMRRAHKHRLKGFYAITSVGDNRVMEIVYNLQQGRPVVFGVGVDDALLHHKKGQVLPPVSDFNVKGYHAMTIVGWKGGHWIIENSWGGWGDEGFAFAEKDYMLGQTASSFWVTTLPYEEGV